jgi:hypothetical protein
MRSRKPVSIPKEDEPLRLSEDGTNAAKTTSQCQFGTKAVVAKSLRSQQVQQSGGVHRCHEGSVAGIADCGHAGNTCGVDVLFAIVDEENRGRWQAEAFSGVTVDCQIRLGDAKPMRICVVREVGEPRVASANACLHRVSDVGENSGLDAALLQPGGPANHVVVGLRPHVEVGVDECVDLQPVDNAMEVGRDCLPRSYASRERQYAAWKSSSLTWRICFMRSHAAGSGGPLRTRP